MLWKGRGDAGSLSPPRTLTSAGGPSPQGPRGAGRGGGSLALFPGLSWAVPTSVCPSGSLSGEDGDRPSHATF